MADNVSLNAGTGGATVRTKDRGGVETQVVILDLNTANSESLMAGVMPVSDNSGSLTVDAPVGTPVFVRLSDGTSAISTLAVSAAQSGSWTVTANAGTNLNTSLLALESGGNLAAINAKLPALGQALAAASVPVVLTAAQLTTLTPVSTVTANAGTGTFAVSAASLPLPSGAATSAKQPAPGTAGSASTDVITVQGITSMTALKVDGSAVTQPVSGTFWQATQPVSGTVTANIGTSGSLALDATLTGGSQKTKLVDSGGTNVATVSAGGALKVDGSAVTQPVSGTFWQATQPVSGTVAATQGGTWTVQPGNTANTTPWLANPLDPAPTTGSITAADGTVASTSNSIGQTVLTGTPDANSSVTATLAGHSAVAIQISGTANLTVAFERSVDGGTTYLPMPMEEAGVGASVSSIAVSDNKAYFFRGSAGGLTNLRVRCTARTSGTLSVKIQPSYGPAMIPVGQGVPNTIGNAWPVKITDGANSMPTGDASARSIHTTVDNSTLAVTQSGTWNVGTVTTVSTVSAVTAISNPLPAGTNLLGRVASSQETSTIYNATTALTPKFAIITASSSGATTVVAAVTSKKLRVLRWRASANGTVNIKWQSHVTPTDISGLSYCTQYKDCGGGFCPVGHFETVAGEALDINLSGNIAVSGELTYVEV